jgi:hypothetical protein
MYIDPEMLFAFGLPLFVVIAVSIQNRNQKIQTLEEIIRHHKYFYKKKDDEEISEFKILDSISIGLAVKNRSIHQICDTWYNWKNFRIKETDENKQPIEFDLTKKNKKNTIYFPSNFNPVEIDIKPYITPRTK